MTITELMKQLEKISKVVDPNTTRICVDIGTDTEYNEDDQRLMHPAVEVHLDIQDGQDYGSHEPVVVIATDLNLVTTAYVKGVSGDEIDLETGKVLDPEEKWLKPWKAIKED